MQIVPIEFTIKNWHHKGYFIDGMHLQQKLLQWTQRRSNDLQQMSIVIHITTRFHFFNRLSVRPRFLFVERNLCILRRWPIPQQYLAVPNGMAVRRVPKRCIVQRTCQHNWCAFAFWVGALSKVTLELYEMCISWCVLWSTKPNIGRTIHGHRHRRGSRE